MAGQSFGLSAGARSSNIGSPRWSHWSVGTPARPLEAVSDGLSCKTRAQLRARGVWESAPTKRTTSRAGGTSTRGRTDGASNVREIPGPHIPGDLLWSLVRAPLERPRMSGFNISSGRRGRRGGTRPASTSSLTRPGLETSGRGVRPLDDPPHRAVPLRRKSAAAKGRSEGRGTVEPPATVAVLVSEAICPRCLVIVSENNCPLVPWYARGAPSASLSQQPLGGRLDCRDGGASAST